MAKFTSQPKISRILHVSLDNVNRVLGPLRESFTPLDKGSLHEGGSGRRQQLVVRCSVIDQ